MRIRVFLSHSAKVMDSSLVRNIVEELRKCGFELYLAEEDTQLGVPIADKISTKIKKSDIVLVLWTDSSSRSSWVNQEISYTGAVGGLTASSLRRD